MGIDEYVWVGHVYRKELKIEPQRASIFRDWVETLVLSVLCLSGLFFSYTGGSESKFRSQEVTSERV